MGSSCISSFSSTFRFYSPAITLLQPSHFQAVALFRPSCFSNCCIYLAKPHITTQTTERAKNHMKVANWTVCFPVGRQNPPTQGSIRASSIEIVDEIRHLDNLVSQHWALVVQYFPAIHCFLSSAAWQFYDPQTLQWSYAGAPDSWDESRGLQLATPQWIRGRHRCENHRSHHHPNPTRENCSSLHSPFAFLPVWPHRLLPMKQTQSFAVWLRFARLHHLGYLEQGQWVKGIGESTVQLARRHSRLRLKSPHLDGLALTLWTVHPSNE